MDNNTAIKCTAALIRAIGMLAQSCLPETRMSCYIIGESDYAYLAQGLESGLTTEEVMNDGKQPDHQGMD